ncbi:MAG: CYTH and CHAD domain-containing protein [Telluria sp.]
MEIELKLAVSPADLQRVMQKPVLDHFSFARPTTEQLHARFFDTADCRLQEQGLSLRVRSKSGGWVQTLKRDGKPGGAFERDEWEMAVPGPEPDLAALLGDAGLPGAVARLLKRLRHDGALQEKFAVRVQRETWQLRMADAQVEMVLDDGAVTCGGASAPVSEIEFELHSGDKAALYALAAELAGYISVHVSSESKSARGYALCKGRPEAPHKAGTIALSRRLNVEAGVQAILASCLQHAGANVRGVLETDDPEYLHQVRVGLRRFRSALKLFEPLVALPEPLAAELSWLGEVLGGARDHDVLALTTLPALAADVDGAGQEQLRPLLERAVAAAAEHRSVLREAMHSPRYGQCMLALHEWVDCARWRQAASDEQKAALRKPLIKFARKAVEEGHARIRKRGRGLHRHDATALHRLRIACKRNRYAVEFFRDLARDKPAARYIKALSALQDTLGQRNDMSVALTLLPALGGDAAALAAPTAFAMGYLSCGANAGLHGVRKPWRQFSRLSPDKLI